MKDLYEICEAIKEHLPEECRDKLVVLEYDDVCYIDYNDWHIVAFYKGSHFDNDWDSWIDYSEDINFELEDIFEEVGEYLSEIKVKPAGNDETTDSIDGMTDLYEICEAIKEHLPEECKDGLKVGKMNGFYHVAYNDWYVVRLNDDGTFDNEWTVWNESDARINTSVEDIFDEIDLDLTEIKVKPVESSKNTEVDEHTDVVEELKDLYEICETIAQHLPEECRDKLVVVEDHWGECVKYDIWNIVTKDEFGNFTNMWKNWIMCDETSHIKLEDIFEELGDELSEIKVKPVGPVENIEKEATSDSIYDCEQDSNSNILLFVNIVKTTGDEMKDMAKRLYGSETDDYAYLGLYVKMHNTIYLNSEMTMHEACRTVKHELGHYTLSEIMSGAVVVNEETMCDLLTNDMFMSSYNFYSNLATTYIAQNWEEL